MDKNNFTEKLDLPSGISSISPEMASSELFRQKFYDTYRTVWRTQCY